VTVIEDLTEEEAYLWAILSDESGIDQAEFFFVDEEKDDGCWRAYPYQWSWFRCMDRYQIDFCGRTLGKSLSIMLRAFAFIFAHPGQEMVVTAPELVHLEPITNLIEEQIRSIRVSREMLVRGRSAVTHRPFMMKFKNGARIIGRIPQITGRGVKGIHPIWLELDEGQDFPERGYDEINETLNLKSEGAVWRIHGVTTGVRGTFWRYTTDSSGQWTVHRYMGMHRPSWSDEEREAKINLYGSREDPDYRRNVLGEHGDETSPIFVLHRLMSCVDDNSESAYNTDVYHNVEVKDEWLRDLGQSVEGAMRLPDLHINKGWATFWAGMDVGFTRHPSEIVVLAEEKVPKAEWDQARKDKKAVPPSIEVPRLRLVTRINLTRIGSPDQHRAIRAVIDHYRPKAFSFDATGVGLPMFQDIQAEIEEVPHIKTIVKGYNFSGKILVDFDQTIDVDRWATKEDMIRETGITRNTVEYATDKLRYLVDNGRLWLPWDNDLLKEMQGQTYKVVRGATDQYGRREFCVDTATEILTQDGWLTYDDLKPGMLVWGYDATSRTAGWTRCRDVHVFDGPNSVMKISHPWLEAVATPNHRWLIDRYRNKPSQGFAQWEHEFVVTEDLPQIKGNARIPLAASRTLLPSERTYSDDFVELVAWYWTEGNASRTLDGRQPQVTISQSSIANPGKTERIRSLLHRLAGPPSRLRDGGLWNEYVARSGQAIWRIGGGLRDELLFVCPETDKVLISDFLLLLTREQLEVFVEVSQLGDGDESRTKKDGYLAISRGMNQSVKGRLDVYQMALTLLGKATTLKQYPKSATWRLNIKNRDSIYPRTCEYSMAVVDAPVWCPETDTGTWLARRGGSTFFTGNSLGKFHAFDALRMAVLGWAQYSIEEFVKKDDRKPVMPVFVSV